MLTEVSEPAARRDTSAEMSATMNAAVGELPVGARVEVEIGGTWYWLARIESVEERRAGRTDLGAQRWVGPQLIRNGNDLAEYDEQGRLRVVR